MLVILFCLMFLSSYINCSALNNEIDFNKIDNFVKGLRSHKESVEVIPEEFLSVWSTFEQLLKEKHD